MIVLRFLRVICGGSLLAFVLFIGSALVCAPGALAQSSAQINTVLRDANDNAGGTPVPAVRKDTAPEPDGLGKPLRYDLDVVLVPVAVTDATNKPIMALKKQSFALFEDNREQQIRYFYSEDVPISVGVILDLSGTMRSKLEVARRAVSEFFDNANPEDDYFVITFSDRPKLVADTTKSIANIQAKLAEAEPAGYTALLDAIYMGVRKLRTARYERRALLIISDGGDNASRFSLKQTKKMLEESDVQVSAIGTFDRELPIIGALNDRLAKQLLNQVTGVTGGIMLGTENVAEIPKIAAAISSNLRYQYVIGYRPTNTTRDGKWRKIKVRVAPQSDQTSFQSFYRRGYLGPKD